MSALSGTTSTNKLVTLLTKAVETIQQGDLAGAERYARSALQIAPSNPDCHLILATVLHNRGHVADAKRHYAQSLSLKPGNARALINLGLLQLNTSEADQAVENLEKALELMPDSVEARHYYARALASDRRYFEANRQFEEVLKAAPGDPDVLSGYARALRAEGRVDDALNASLEALERKPDDDAIHRDLAANYAAKGDFDAAETEARTSLRLAPAKTAAYKQLGAYRRISDDDIAQMEELASQPDTLSSEDRAALFYALGVEQEKKGAYDRAFDLLSSANRINEQQAGYNRQEKEEYFEALTAASAAEQEAEWPQGHDSDKMIFIVGMPRSGTTLVEQILSAHPAVFAGGELPTMPQGVERLMRDDSRYTTAVGSLDSKQLKELGQFYLDRLPEGAAAAMRVTDKLPGNITSLPLIARMFPNARIVLCRRHPLDVAWSIFKHGFAENLDFATSLANIAHMQNLVCGFMDYWAQEMPGRTHQVWYEKLVTDTEAGARALVEFAGLDWDDACLRPQDSVRSVMTASLWQVRQPVFSTSVGSWTNFEQHLEEVRQEMREHIEAHEAATA